VEIGETVNAGGGFGAIDLVRRMAVRVHPVLVTSGCDEWKRRAVDISTPLRSKPAKSHARGSRLFGSSIATCH
jgi:hypothetical protein